MNTHTSQVTKPLIRIRPRSSTAKFLPTTAMFPFVEISEGTPRRFAFELSGNHLAHVASLLDRNLGNTAATAVRLDSSAATSPTAKTPLTPGTIKNGSTGSLPARSVGTPSVFTTGEAATPAVHKTVALGILFLRRRRLARRPSRPSFPSEP